MYCFSKLCRICLKECATDFMSLLRFDHDDIQIHEKLTFCMPEIVYDKNFPENICSHCYLFLQQMFNFKHMYLENTNILCRYIKKLFEGFNNSGDFKSDLYIDLNKSTIKTEIQTEEKDRYIQDEEKTEVSMFSISLNQWDLFETKFNCRCNKEYTENTEHLCKNCEGELIGFRLSKIKVGNAQNRYNDSLSDNQLINDDSNSNCSQPDAIENCSKTYENGFNYNDFSLSKVHVNGINKQINDLEEIKQEQCDQIDDEEENQINASEENQVNSDEEISFEASTSSKKEKYFKCSICDKSYTRRYNLHKHYIKHNTELYTCSMCESKFATNDDLFKHEQKHRYYSTTDIIEVNPDDVDLSLSSDENQISDSEHNDQNDEEVVKAELNSSSDSSYCFTCNKTFNNNSQLVMHLMTHRSKQEFHCRTCGKEFFSKTTFEDHLKQHTKKYSCNQCGRNYNFLTNLKRHQTSHDPNNTIMQQKYRMKFYDGKKYHCDQCDKAYNFLSNLRRHQRNHNSNSTAKRKINKLKKKFTCKICNRSYNLRESLREHQRVQGHQNEKKEFQCDKCNKSYNFKSNLYRHKIIHEGQYSCSICNMKFDEKEVLEAHIFTVHTKQMKVEKITCSSCDESFSDNETLHKHKQYKLGVKKVKKSKKRKTKEGSKNKKDSLKVRKHYSCGVCHKSFKYLMNLKVHTLSHFQPKKKSKTDLNVGKGHYCEICDRHYSIKTNMKKHMLTHTSGKVKKCNVCQLSFTNRFLLIQHARTHVDQLFNCHVCNTTYATKNNLVRHITLRHKL